MSTKENNNKSSVLKATREAKGFSLDIVHEATKIPMDVLKAIEEGYSVRILSPFYYRGFIKIYAEFLGLDAGETYKQYGLDQAAKASVATTPVKPRAKTPQPNVTLGPSHAWFSVLFSPKNFKKVFKVIGILVILFGLFRMAGCVVSHLVKKPGITVARNSSSSTTKAKRAKAHKYIEEQKSVPVSAHVSSSAPAVTAPPKSAPVLPKHESVKAQSENHKVQVAIRAMRDTWIEVKTDDKVVFQMTLSKGSMESWNADNHIELSGRNLDQLDMEINGKHIGTLGSAERRIRKVLITQEGLTVKK
jgi:cytoskeletal protein RodZ